MIYPNPTDGDFSIDLGTNYREIDVNIIDINGKIIQSNNFTDSQLLDIKLKEASGVYLVIITSEAHKAIFRLVLK